MDIIINTAPITLFHGTTQYKHALIPDGLKLPQVLMEDMYDKSVLLCSASQDNLVGVGKN